MLTSGFIYLVHPPSTKNITTRVPSATPQLARWTNRWICARFRYIYVMAESRRNIEIRRLHEQDEDTNFENTTPSEHISMMGSSRSMPGLSRRGFCSIPTTEHTVRLLRRERWYLLVGAYALATRLAGDEESDL